MPSSPISRRDASSTGENEPAISSTVKPLPSSQVTSSPAPRARRLQTVQQPGSPDVWLHPHASAVHFPGADNEVTGYRPSGRDPVALFLGNAPSAVAGQAPVLRQSPHKRSGPSWVSLSVLRPTPHIRTDGRSGGGGYAVWGRPGLLPAGGSLDSAVERDSMVANDFGAFFAEHPSIETVFFTGGAAQATTGGWHSCPLTVRYVRLPRPVRRTPCRSR